MTEDHHRAGVALRLSHALGSYLPSSSPAKIALAAAAVLSIHWVIKRRSGPSNQAGKTDFNSYLIEKSVPTKAAKSRGHVSTSFDSYLKKSSSRPAKTDFNAYLIEADDESPDEAADATPLPVVDDAPSNDQVVVTVLFGTEYGFAKEIAEKLCEYLRDKQQYWPQLLDMADGPAQCDLAREQVILTVCSTQGDGVAPSEAREFVDWLQSSEAPQLSSVHYSVCALGDNSYTHFCACGKSLDARFAELGSKQLVARKDVHREDWRAVEQWLQSVVTALGGLELKTVGDLGGYSKSCNQQDHRVSRSRPFLARVVAVEGLCSIQTAADKDTIRVEFDISGSDLEYEPGDALGIHASNAPQVVDDLMSYLHADPQSVQPLPSWHYLDERLSGSNTIKLYDMLTYCYDLRSPKKQLLKCLRASMPELSTEHNPIAKEAKPVVGSHRTNGYHSHAESDIHSSNDLKGPANGKSITPELANGHVPNGRLNAKDASTAVTPQMTFKEQVTRLDELIASPLEELEMYLEPRHVIDILQDFNQAKLTLDQLLQCLSPLQPRLYSISSSPLERPGRVQATVAVVRYRSLQQDRFGVASTLLADRLKVGEKLPVYLSRNPDFRLPKDASTPIIMVGPGTGIAPFRAFILQRLLSGGPFGKSTLFFGCRQSKQDYLYGNSLEAWAKAGHIRLHTAFSRQQKSKIYVQDRLREAENEVWEALEMGGHFYVCGDASSMAGAVETALLDIIASHQVQGREAAESYLQSLREERRYQRDVWF